jgi:uncharacterized protein YaaR (DUF327 family)
MLNHTKGQVEEYESQLSNTKQKLEAAEVTAAEMDGVRAKTEAEAQEAVQAMEVRLKQAEDTAKQQLKKMASALRSYGRKKTRARSDVDVDLQRYVVSWCRVVCCDVDSLLGHELT